jgi:hypothetical protein
MQNLLGKNKASWIDEIPRENNQCEKDKKIEEKGK